MDKLDYIHTNNIGFKKTSKIPKCLITHSRFSSERIFPLHCINNGFIEGIKLKFNLYKRRKLFKYIGLPNAPEQENTSN
jgi:hypothetical protein